MKVADLDFCLILLKLQCTRNLKYICSTVGVNKAHFSSSTILDCGISSLRHTSDKVVYLLFIHLHLLNKM